MIIETCLTITSVIGAIICLKKRKLNKNPLYKSGFLFFVFYIISAIFRFVTKVLISPIIINNAIEEVLLPKSLAWKLLLLDIPEIICIIAVHIILVIGFYKSFKDINNYYDNLD